MFSFWAVDNKTFFVPKNIVPSQSIQFRRNSQAARDPLRKLSQTDRIFGTMSLAIDHGIEPANMAVGALAGIDLLLKNPDVYNLPPPTCAAPIYSN